MSKRAEIRRLMTQDRDQMLSKSGQAKKAAGLPEL
jgi:hypothetical protein